MEEEKDEYLGCGCVLDHEGLHECEWHSEQSNRRDESRRNEIEAQRVWWSDLLSKLLDTCEGQVAFDKAFSDSCGRRNILGHIGSVDPDMAEIDDYCNENIVVLSLALRIADGRVKVYTARAGRWAALVLKKMGQDRSRLLNFYKFGEKYKEIFLAAEEYLEGESNRLATAVGALEGHVEQAWPDWMKS